MLRTLEGRSLPISILIHGAAVGALVVTSALLPEPFPETLVRASAPVSFPMDPRPRPAEVAIARPRARRHSSVLPPATGELPRTASPTDGIRVLPTGPDVPSTDVADFGDGALGGCQTGCVVTMADSFGGGGSEGPETAPAAYRIGGNLRPPRKIRNVAPEYPEIARRAHISGEVEVDCLIDEEGHVREAAAVKGNPLLAPAAVAAVERWVYEPSLLNGVRVQVLMTVTVRFQLK